MSHTVPDTPARDPDSEVPAWIRRVGAGSVALVAVVAAVVSYFHMHTVALRAGEGWRAWLDPLSVDGLLVGASLVIYVKGRRAGWVTWMGLGLGIVVSLAANLAASNPDLLSRVVNGWPAVSLALSFEVLLRLVRHPGAKARHGAPAADPVPGEAGEDQASVDEAPGDDLVARARQLVTAGEAQGGRYGRGRLAHELGISTHQARQLLDRIAKDRRPVLHAVGGTS